MADTLLLRDVHGQQFVIDVHVKEIEEGSFEYAEGEVDENEWRDDVQLHKEEKTVLRYYVFEGMRYIWMPRKGAFCRVSILSEGWTYADLHRFQQGMSQVLNPFYMFQVFSIILWMSERYYYYAVCILIISFLSIAVSLYEIRKQSTTLRRMAQLIVNVTVRRATGEEECVSSVDLVPGDCVVIPSEGLLLPCDAALLAGECMVNESMLTGEKTKKCIKCAVIRSFLWLPFTMCMHFCFTAVLLKTFCFCSSGFFTAKGDLVSSILYPQPLNFRFYKDAMKFLLFLGVLALIGTIYSVVMLYKSNTPWAELVIRSLDIVTIVVPPALPAAITTGTIYAQNRLKKKGVFCISPPRINISGKISLFCFDKVRQIASIVRRFPFSSTLQRMSVVTVGPGGGSACCFLKGSPEMVASYCVKESVPSQFTNTLREFASEGFRVLALAYRELDAQTDLSSLERSTEMRFLGLLVMKNQVKPESPGVISTLRQAQIRPVMVTGDNILTALNVAHACRMVLPHEQVFFVHASPPTVNSMASLRFHQGEGGTGTGLYQNSLKYHLAINGKSFAVLCDHFPEYLPKILMRGTVYARMSPDQKTQLVKALQNLNYRVGMCGDGANDCGALRAADVGVSLSEAEASVASPFTSKTDNISCVPLLIREGRCSLVTSFSLFKYMALYSLIQFSSVVILYTVKTNLADLQFLFCDLFLVTLLAIVMGRGGPSDELHPQRPPASLLSVPLLCALLIHTLLLIVTQVSVLLITISQEWYIPLNSTRTGPQNLPNMEDTGVFDVSGFQYILMSIIVTKGYPYKKPLYYNGAILKEHLGKMYIL
uniref:P-type ATPase A domain-containing protein n=1 Tax=Pygocentrus nattereri TaxID=42514 RepID=A0AAR2JBK1_PYGNA